MSAIFLSFPFTCKFGFFSRTCRPRNARARRIVKDVFGGAKALGSRGRGPVQIVNEQRQGTPAGDRFFPPWRAPPPYRTRENENGSASLSGMRRKFRRLRYFRLFSVGDVRFDDAVETRLHPFPAVACFPNTTHGEWPPGHASRRPASAPGPMPRSLCHITLSTSRSDDRLTVVAAAHHVVDCALEFDSWFARHPNGPSTQRQENMGKED